MKRRIVSDISSIGRCARRPSISILLVAAFLSANLRPAPSSASEPAGWFSSAWSATTSATKKGWNTTVDVVTLKPIRQSLNKKNAPKNEIRLGTKPDPRKAVSKSSPGLLGSLFAPKPTPQKSQTLEEFFSQERPK